MHQIIPVTNPYSPTVVTAFGTALVATHTVVDPLVTPLTPSQSAGLINVGPMKGAEISDIITELMATYPGTIPPNITMAIINSLQQEEKDCNAAQAACIALANIFDNHGKIIRNNLMVITGQSFDIAKLLGKTNTAIETVVKSLTETYNSRSTPSVGTKYTVAMGGNVAVNGVNPLKTFTNDGMAMLSILNVGGNAANTIKVYPNSATALPKGWTNILVTNLSLTIEGSFLLFIK